MLLHPPARSAVSAAPTLSLTVVGLMFGLVMGLGAPLFTLEMVDLGFGTGMIAANTMMHAVGSLAIAPFIPRISMALGPKRAVTLALLTGAATLALFSAVAIHLGMVWPARGAGGCVRDYSGAF